MLLPCLSCQEKQRPHRSIHGTTHPEPCRPLGRVQHLESAGAALAHVQSPTFGLHQDGNQTRPCHGGPAQPSHCSALQDAVAQVRLDPLWPAPRAVLSLRLPSSVQKSSVSPDRLPVRQAAAYGSAVPVRLGWWCLQALRRVGRRSCTPPHPMPRTPHSPLLREAPGVQDNRTHAPTRTQAQCTLLPRHPRDVVIITQEGGTCKLASASSHPS